jgi:hypothetical protein
VRSWVTSSAPSRKRLDFAASEVDLDRLARPALVVGVVAAAVLIYHLTRGSSFSTDDWAWIDARRGNSLHTFLAPYNDHLSLVPIAIYRLMFAVFGIGDFAPYRVLLLVVASATAIAIFAYARQRAGGFCALLVATLLLFLGPGWNDIMQPFQIAWLIAVASGIVAFSLLDRRRTGSDAFACLLVLVSISSTSVGVALAIGIAIDIALARRRWRDAWIVGLPLLLYVVWVLHYHPTELQLSSITSVPLNLVRTTAAAVAGVVGLSGVTPTDVTGLALTFGVALLVLAVAAVIVRTGRGWDWSRFVSLATALVMFSGLTSLARAFQSPFESRYMYVVCVLATLMAVELARGLSVPFRVQLALAVLTLVAVVSNIGVLRSGGGFLRQLGAQTDATLAAVQLDRDTVASDTPLRQLPFYPLVVVTAGQYFRAEHALGTPAYTIAQLQHANTSAQGAADRQSIDDGDVTFAAGGAARRGACVSLPPAAALAAGQASTLAVRLSPGRVSVASGAAPAAISVRRFAPTFTALGTLQTRATAIVSVARDRAAQSWRLQVQSTAPVHVCTLGGT